MEVLGAKFSRDLQEVDISVELQEKGAYRMHGLLSKAADVAGRSSGDRQYLYMNGRPVDIPKLARMFNEVYRTAHVDKYPSFVLNLVCPAGAYDINVTPDKRTIYLVDESDLVGVFRVRQPDSGSFSRGVGESGRSFCSK